MKLNRYDKVMTFMCVILLTFFIGILVGQKHPHKLPVEPIKTKVDTLVIRDTITQIQPISIEKKAVDKQLVKITDTLIIHDTLYVYLDREQVVWQDSLSVIYASGINPQVDSVRHFTSHQIITIEKTIPVTKKTYWGLGVQAGYGLGYADKRIYGVPYIGVGISYNLLSW